jgi:type IV pilus assembly protein PilM
VGWVVLFVSKILSLDIGADNTKIAQVKVRGKKIKVTKYVMFDTPKDSLDDGRVVDVGILSDEIRNQIISNKLTARETIITISGTSIITREITLPKVKTKELKSIIEMEAPQSFPIELTNYLLDYKILEEVNTDEGLKYRILMIAAPHNIISGYVELVAKSGLHLNAIDYLGNSIVKFISMEVAKSDREIDATKAKAILQKDAFEYMMNKKMSILKFVNNESIHDGHKSYIAHNDSMAVIDMGAKTTTVTIISNGVMQFSRMLLYGGEKITHVIAEALGITFEEAEEKKKQYGIILDVDEGKWSDEELLINESIRRALSDFIDDITHFFDFYNSRGQGKWIDHMYLIGGGGLLKGLDEYIGNGFNTKAEALRKFRSISYSKKHSDFADKLIFYPNCLGAVINR